MANTSGILTSRNENRSMTVYLASDQVFPTVLPDIETNANITGGNAYTGGKIGAPELLSSDAFAHSFTTTPDNVNSLQNSSVTAEGTMMFSDTSLLGSQFWSLEPSTTMNLNDTNATLSPKECEDLLMQFREANRLVFDYAELVRVSVTWAVFLLSAVGNLFVLSSVTVRRRRRHMSHSQLMMLHLTFANLAFTFFILPLDAIWNTTRVWVGGDVLCRLMNVLKQFAMYISSAMIVVMGADRVATLMFPVSAPAKMRRIRTMLALAWVFSFVNAIPAGIIFSVISVPWSTQCSGILLTQCVDLEVKYQVDLNGYYIYTMVISFFGPLVCIKICYLFIAISISRMARISKEAQKRCSMKNRGSSKSVTRRSLDRARRMSQIVTGLITATFILCWGPYYVVGLIQWFDNASHEDVHDTPEKRLSPMAEVVMLMSMYLNPCLHPLITVLLMKEVRSNILTQCKSTRSPGPRLPPRKSSSKKKGMVAKNGKNGTKQELLLNDPQLGGNSDSIHTHRV